MTLKLPTDSILTLLDLYVSFLFKLIYYLCYIMDCVILSVSLSFLFKLIYYLCFSFAAVIGLVVITYCLPIEEFSIFCLECKERADTSCGKGI